MMGKTIGWTMAVLVGIAAGSAAWWHWREPKPAGLPAGKSPGPAPAAALTIRYPFDGAVFPPEIFPPTFFWEDAESGAHLWRITFEFHDGQPPVEFTSQTTQWSPPADQWETIKRRSRENPTEVRIAGMRSADSPTPVSAGHISISTSKDAVGAPLFFREVNLPFLTAVKNPAAYIRWRFGPITAKRPPPIVLEKLPVCGNCHSFSADGRTLAMEVDSGNDKGGYAIAPIEPEITLDRSKIITWADYRREDRQKTFGLLCQASPDGRYIAGTVKDRALAVYRPELAFSQLFFLVKGIVCIYDRKTKTFRALPGADDPHYVQTNATWSPDGKWIVFAKSRSPAYDPPGLRGVDTVLVPPKLAREFLRGGRKFLYDLYRVPFNGGKGGKAEPIPGASNNGMSNYFAKYSPDGKWIVFCKAKSFMLLQPDSQLYVIPAEGGTARRLRCNTPRMNSWHSFSPNGRWLVFSSKVFSDYTQLLLTHFDEQGRTTPPVWLENFVEPNRAANIPEFVNAKPDAIKHIEPAFLDDTNYLRAGDAFHRQGDYEEAIPYYRKALAINPSNAEAHVNWGLALMALGKVAEAKTRFLRAIELDPDLAPAHCNLGIVLRSEGRLEEAAAEYRRALELDPELQLAHLHFGTLLLELGSLDEATAELEEAVRLNPRDAFALYNLGLAYHAAADYAQAVDRFAQALKEDPEFVPALVSLALLRATCANDAVRDGREAIELAEKACELSGGRNPEALHALAAAYAEVGDFQRAIAAADRAANIAREAGNPSLADAIEHARDGYRQHRPLRMTPGKP